MRGVFAWLLLSLVMACDGAPPLDDPPDRPPTTEAGPPAQVAVEAAAVAGRMTSSRYALDVRLASVASGAADSSTFHLAQPRR